MQNRILASIISAIAYICLNAAGAHAQKDVRRVPFAVAVDSVEWRDDLTRVYCRITGHPHTSGRIDAVAMDIPVPGAAMWRQISTALISGAISNGKTMA